MLNTTEMGKLMKLQNESRAEKSYLFISVNSQSREVRTEGNTLEVKET